MPSFVSGSHILLPDLSQILEHSLQLPDSLGLFPWHCMKREQACMLFSSECLEPAPFSPAPHPV